MLALGDVYMSFPFGLGDMSYSLNSVGYIRGYLGDNSRVNKGNTRSLDYCAPRYSTHVMDTVRHALGSYCQLVALALLISDLPGWKRVAPKSGCSLYVPLQQIAPVFRNMPTYWISMG